MLTAADRKMLDISTMTPENEDRELPEDFFKDALTGTNSNRQSELSRVTAADLQRTLTKISLKAKICAVPEVR